MPDLAHAQRDFVAAVRHAEDGGRALRWLAGDDALVARRLAVYRANMVAAADKALAGAYPVIRQAVGDEFFHGLAREYQRAGPSTSGDLAEFGHRFHEFLAQFEHVDHLPWLPDLARLEWAAHVAYGAADATAWDAAALAEVPADRQADLRFAWAPGTAVIESAWPIVRVWTIHQPGFEGAFQVDWSVPERAWVARDGQRIMVATLDAGEAAFLGRSLAGATLGEAIASAVDADPAFALDTLLGRAAAAGLLQGFDLTP
jgi:hypothetical protein